MSETIPQASLAEGLPDNLTSHPANAQQELGKINHHNIERVNQHIVAIGALGQYAVGHDMMPLKGSTDGGHLKGSPNYEATKDQHEANLLRNSLTAGQAYEFATGAKVELDYAANLKAHAEATQKARVEAGRTSPTHRESEARLDAHKADLRAMSIGAAELSKAQVEALQASAH